MHRIFFQFRSTISFISRVRTLVAIDNNEDNEYAAKEMIQEMKIVVIDIRTIKQTSKINLQPWW
jgi:hypothetical protein